MDARQKSFLDDFAVLLRRYNFSNMQIIDNRICFFGHNTSLKMEAYSICGGIPKFREVITDYIPEESELKNE